MDHKKFQKLILELYVIVEKLEAMFPGRHFTPDGVLVGSIGECLVADAYGLELETASNKGFDATPIKGEKIQIEIKATQSKSVAFRSEPEHTIIIKILPDGTFEEVYNGPGDLVWKQFANKDMPKNGQYQISLNKLRKLHEDVSEKSRVPRIA
jgi:hypothetical protein